LEKKLGNSVSSPWIICYEAFYLHVVSSFFCVIIIYINDNDAVINNNYGTPKELILLFKIPMGTGKDFFKIHRQFGHAPSKISPALD
jgi:hypothetical protein